MSDIVIEHLLVLDRLLAASVHEGVNVEKIRLLAERYRKGHSELTKEADIVAQQVSELLKAKLSELAVTEEAVSPLVVREPRV